MLGVPFNIASYGLLLCLLCMETGMKPGNLSGMLCDCHIYENHIDGANEQLSRVNDLRQLPTIVIDDFESIFTWEASSLSFNNYNPHPKINFEIAV
jgi:thymidylate synthase